MSWLTDPQPLGWLAVYADPPRAPRTDEPRPGPPATWPDPSHRTDEEPAGVTR